MAPPVAAQDDGDFKAWARKEAIPLDAQRRGFRSLDRVVTEARLIGVGESVHETETFLTFRFQLLQDLVRRHRVTAVVLESGMPEAMALDDYVRGRTSTVDFEDALTSGYGSLREFRNTMTWLREWNRGEGRRRPVSIYGSDLPGRAGNMIPALDRLPDFSVGDPVVKTLIDSIRPVAVQIGSGWWRGAAQKYDPLPAETKLKLANDVSLLVERVNYISRGAGERGEWAMRMAFVIQQLEAQLRLGAYSATVPRDLAMAENTLWVLTRIAPDERAVYWAHNAHVQKVDAHGGPLPPGPLIGAGRRFAVVLGKQYLAIGTAYGGPARDDGSSTIPGSVDGVLETVNGGRPFLLILRPDGPQPPAIASWLSQERPMRFQTKYLDLALGQAFDVLAYFDQAVPAVRVGATE
jgi:erythromycin esterase